MPTGYIKTTSMGDEECLILDPRQAHVRETLLPADWTHIRLCAFLSICGLDDGNSIPVAETVGRNGPLDDFYLGLTDTPDGYPGDAATRFLGLGIYNNSESKWATAAVANSSGWKPFGTDGYYALSAMLWNRGAFARSTFNSSGATQYAADFCPSYNPQAETGFAFRLTANIRLTYGSTPTIAEADFASNIPTVAATDVSAASAIQAVATPLGAASYMSSALSSGAWWTSKTTSPVGCRYLYLRAPWRNNRLRIHALQAIKLA